MTVFLDFPRLHQIPATTRIQFYQKCPMGSIFSYVFIWRIFNELKPLDTYLMEFIVKMFEGIVPSHGVTQQWAFFCCHHLGVYPCLFKIWGLIIRRHQYVRLPYQAPSLPFQIRDGINLNLPSQIETEINLNFPFQMDRELFIPSSSH